MRTVFLEGSRVALELVSASEVAAKWDEPSSLPEFSIRGLAGHLYRATGSVEAYLARPEPDASPIDAPTYYAQAVAEPDIHSELHRAVRQRGEEAATGGHAALVADWRDMIGRLEDRLRSESPERKVRVFQDLVLTLDDYLATRLVELVVHCDDVALSAGLPMPDMPREAFDVAISCLVDVARVKHGDVAVVRALARRERDEVRALRVL